MLQKDEFYVKFILTGKVRGLRDWIYGYGRKIGQLNPNFQRDKC